MIEHWEEYKIEEFRLPGFSDRATFFKTFFKGDGRWVEACRVFDCDRHFRIGGEDQDVCLMTGEPQTIDSDYVRQCGKTTICTHVCPYKKNYFKKFIEDHGQYLDDTELQHIKEFISKEETICGEIFDIEAAIRQYKAFHND